MQTIASNASNANNAAAAIVDNVPAGKRADIISIIKAWYFNGSKQITPAAAADEHAIITYIQTDRYIDIHMQRLRDSYINGTPEQFSSELHDIAGYLYWRVLAYQGPAIGSTYTLATYD